MGRIRPFKFLAALGVLFIIFSVSQLHEKKAKTPKNSDTKSATKKESKIVSPQEAVTILHHLFHNKVEDQSIKCRIKKAKTRYFVACKGGDILQDNYWEVRTKKDTLTLLTRSKTALYLAKKYPYKELKIDNFKNIQTVESALITFFKDP